MDMQNINVGTLRKFLEGVDDTTPIHVLQEGGNVGFAGKCNSYTYTFHHIKEIKKAKYFGKGEEIVLSISF